MMPNRKQEFLNAVKTGTIATVDALLREDPALANTGDDSGVSALLLAQYSNQCDVVTRLLMNKSELDVFEAAALGLTERLAPFVG
jgi:ankyrin repeat protein